MIQRCMSLSFGFQGISGNRVIPIDGWPRHCQGIPYTVDVGDMNKQSIASNRPLFNRR
jgi:hypothetical protein